MDNIVHVQQIMQGWPPHFLARTWATPYDHALID